MTAVLRKGEPSSKAIKETKATLIQRQLFAVHITNSMGRLAKKRVSVTKYCQSCQTEKAELVNLSLLTFDYAR